MACPCVFDDNTTNKTLSFLESTLDCTNSQNCSGLIDINNETDWKFAELKFKLISKKK